MKIDLTLKIDNLPHSLLSEYGLLVF